MNNYTVFIIISFIILNEYINQCNITLLIVVYHPPLKTLIFVSSKVSLIPLASSAYISVKCLFFFNLLLLSSISTLGYVLIIHNSSDFNEYLKFQVWGSGKSFTCWFNPINEFHYWNQETWHNSIFENQPNIYWKFSDFGLILLN